MAVKFSKEMGIRVSGKKKKKTKPETMYIIAAVKSDTAF